MGLYPDLFSLSSIFTILHITHTDVSSACELKDIALDCTIHPLSRESADDNGKQGMERVFSTLVRLVPIYNFLVYTNYFNLLIVSALQHRIYYSNYVSVVLFCCAKFSFGKRWFDIKDQKCQNVSCFSTFAISNNAAFYDLQFQ